MKTLNQFFKLKPLLLCGRLLYSLRLSLWLPVLSFMQINANQPLAPVFREVRAGLNAFGKTSEANTRLYFGLGVLIAAPLLSVVYLVFPEHGGDRAWYHFNYYHLFYLIGPELFLLFTLSGIFFLFPTNSRRAYFLVIPMGQTLAKLFIFITATSNNEIHAIVPVRLIIEMAVCMAPILFSFNYLMDRQFHKLDGIKARIDGLRSLMKSEYSALMESEQKKLKDFQKQF